MKIVAGFAIVMVVVSFPAASPGADTGKKAGNNPEVTQALQVVERILKGDRVNELDLKNLDEAVIRLESVGPQGEVKTEAPGAPAPQKNIYILRFTTGGSDERQLQILRIQRAILKNQLVLLKSLSTIANHQVLLGTRTARVESAMRDVTLGMMSESSEMKKVRGETASTGAKVTDLAGTTTDMTDELKVMAKDINELEGTLGNVDSMIGKLSEGMEDQGSEIARGMRNMGDNVADQVSAAGSAIRSDIEDMNHRTKNQLNDIQENMLTTTDMEVLMSTAASP